MKSRAVIFMLACWVLTSSGASAQSKNSSSEASPAPTVRWKFTRGQTLRYQCVEEMDTRRVEGELTYPLANTKTTVEVRWFVEDVDRDGTATITETIEHLQESATGPKGTHENDSKTTRKGRAAFAGVKFSFRMSTHGHTSDMTLPTGLEKTLEARGGDELGDWFRVVMRHVMPGFPLPTDDSCRTQPWSKVTESPRSTPNPLRYTKTYDYAGQQLRDGQTIDEFRIASSTQVVDNPGAVAKFDFDKSAGKGTLQFDTTAGRLLTVTEQSRSEYRMTVGIVSTQVRSRSKITWRLLPAPGEPGYVAVPESN